MRVFAATILVAAFSSATAQSPVSVHPDSGESHLVNIRRLTKEPNPNVVSYSIDDEYGWVTAATPAKRLLIGYVWKTKDYLWVSLWRDTREGRPSARGLEFGLRDLPTRVLRPAGVL